MSMRKTTKGKGTIAKIKGIKKGIKKKENSGDTILDHSWKNHYFNISKYLLSSITD